MKRRRRTVLSEQPDSIVRNTAFSFAVKLSGGLFTAGLTLFLVRALGPEDYGVFSLAVGIGAIVVLVADFGVSASAARFVAEHREEDSDVRRVLVDAFKLKIVASAALSALLFALADPVANAYETPALTWPLRAVSLAVFAQSLMLLFLAAFEALWRVSLTLRIVVAESAVETGASIALVLLGGGAAGAVFGRAAGYVCALLVGIPLLLGAMGGRASKSTTRRGGLRRLAGYAVALSVITGAMTLFNRIDILLIGAYFGPAAVGMFEAPLKVASLLHYGGLAVSGGVAPRMARTPEREPNAAVFTTALRYLILGQGLLLAPVVVWATPLVDVVLGSGYDQSAEVLRALAPFVFLAGLAPLVAVAVNYLGEARRRVWLAIGAVGINLVIDLILIPRIGIVGGAIGTDVAYLLYVPGHLWICTTLIDLDVRPVLATTARALAAAGAMSGVLAALGTEGLSPSEWIVGLVAGPLAYVATLVVLRELTLGEMVTGARGLKNRLRRA